MNNSGNYISLCSLTPSRGSGGSAELASGSISTFPMLFELLLNGAFADFLRCLLLTYGFKYARRSRLENQQNRRRRYASYL